MAKRIVAVVEEGEPSEALAPVLQALGRGGATIRLLRVMAPVKEVVTPDGRMIAYIDQETARAEAEGLSELARIEALLADVDVDRVVRFGDATEQALLEADAFDADLITVAGGARGRLATAIRPDVADRVAREAPIPTLVLRQP